MVGEHDFEPVRGLPGKLPPGERILWQGSPAWRALAWRAFFVKPVAIYFGIIAAWRVLHGVTGAAPFGESIASAVGLALPFLAAAGVLGLIAWLTARSTTYTITNRRLVMSFGLAMPMAINLPYRQITSASMRTGRGDIGDLPVELNRTARLAYLHLWPHARPWRFSHPEPMLRAVPEAKRVAGILAEALQAAAAEPLPRERTGEAPEAPIPAVPAGPLAPAT